MVTLFDQPPLSDEQAAALIAAANRVFALGEKPKHIFVYPGSLLYEALVAHINRTSYAPSDGRRKGRRRLGGRFKWRTKGERPWQPK